MLNIEYNELNLPKQVTGTAVGTVIYGYSATGEKLSKQTPVEARSYIDGIEYTGTTIDLLHMGEGVARNNGGSYTFEHFLKDHLGNTRIVYNSAGAVLQQTDYYPFGLGIARYQAVPNKYKYNGREKQEELGQYDYGARFYDPVIGRWHVVDPLAYKYPSLSPYCFVANNPIRYIDPDGREIVDPQGRRAIYYDKKGGMHYTKYATADIKRVAGALNLTTEGATQLKRINSSDIKTKISISSDSKIETKSDGTHYTYGETEQGNRNNPPTYSKYQNDDGSFGIKEATITIFEGTLKEGIKAGSGLEHEGLTLEQAIGAVAGHEGIHATDKAEINKDIQAEFGTRKQQAARDISREVKPEAVEKKIIRQSKKLND